MTHGFSPILTSRYHYNVAFTNEAGFMPVLAMLDEKRQTLSG